MFANSVRYQETLTHYGTKPRTIMINKKGYVESHHFLLSIIGEAPYGIMAIDIRGSITIANNLVLKYLDLNMSIEDLLESDVIDIVGNLKELKEKISVCLREDRKKFNIHSLFYNNKYLTFKGRKISDGMIITISDITPIKESQYNALNSMLEGQEQERKRLAREIHDGIGPTLSTLKMNLANIEGDIEGVSHELAEKFRKSYEMIDEAANDIRSISHNLMPKVLSDFGLIEALDSLCEKIDKIRKVDVDFIHSGFDKRVDEVTELGLYRIAQELINNTLKHASAEKITLQLIKRDHHILMMYEDNGLGFKLDEISKGIGLMNIENRAKALGGEVMIDSQPDKGMTATIEIPIN